MTSNNEQTPKPGAGSAIKLVAVAALAGLLGYGAVYLMGTPGANVPEPTRGASAPRTEAPAKPVDASTLPSPVELANLPAGPGRNPLSVGEMAMFVFKAPQDLPEFAFNDGGGAERQLTDWQGKVVLVNLWATWCAPCRKEMPDLNRLQAMLGGTDFEVVAVSLDRGTNKKPKAFLEELELRDLALYHDPTARMGNRLQAIGLPATLLLDRKGREIGRLVGPAKWDSEDAVRLVRTAIEVTRPAG